MLSRCLEISTHRTELQWLLIIRLEISYLNLQIAMPVELHPNQIPLRKDAIVWRYMDLDKYLSLLDRSALFFCRADKFSDPFEGSIPRREAEYRPKEARKNAWFHRRLFDEERAIKNIEALKKTHKDFKRGVVINCWHINDNESDTMWRLYLKDNEGVAIQSTCARITEALEKVEEKIELSRVRYLDYDKDIWYHPREYPHISYNLIVPLLHKRIEFVSENEYRLYHQIQEAINDSKYWEAQENHKGKFIKVDLKTLIETIYLPPTIDQESMERIKAQTKERGYDFEFRVSRLKDEPYY